MQSQYVFLGSCIIVLIFLFTDIKSQDKYQVSGTIYVRDGNSTRVSLDIKTNGETIKVPVDNNGNFLTFIEWNKIYYFLFSKPGYVSKIVEFNSSIPQNIYKEDIFPYELLVELFPKFPYADTVFYKKPVAKIKFSVKIRDFDYDLDYQLAIKNKVEKNKDDYVSWLNEMDQHHQEMKLLKDARQKEAATRYQKTVETVIASKNTTPVTIKPIVNTNKVIEENPFGAPPLSEYYKEGKTVEVFNLNNKIVTRVVIKKGEYQKVFYQVKHNWGGLYYFIQESPVYFRSISKYNFDKSTSG